MNEQDDLRRNFISASLGHTAYRTWAQQARKQRFFNIARLFDALSMAKQVRADEAFYQLGEVGDTLTNVQRAYAGLEPSSIETGPVTATTSLTRTLLERAQIALRDNQDLGANDLGDIVVCSRCGELREADIIGACPICGTVIEAHYSFRAIDAMGTLGPHSIMHNLEQSLLSLPLLFQDVSEELASEHLPQHRASLKEYAGALIENDTIFRERAWRLLDSDNPTLPTITPPGLEQVGYFNEKTIPEILQRFQQSRTQTLQQMRGLTSAAWHRTGYHTLFGQINVLHQGNWIVTVEHSALVDMAQIRHDLLAKDLPQTVIAPVREGE
jgi:rubrerythrin